MKYKVGTLLTDRHADAPADEIRVFEVVGHTSIFGFPAYKIIFLKNGNVRIYSRFDAEASFSCLATKTFDNDLEALLDE